MANNWRPSTDYGIYIALLALIREVPEGIVAQDAAIELGIPYNSVSGYLKRLEALEMAKSFIRDGQYLYHLSDLLVDKDEEYTFEELRKRMEQ